MSLRFEVCTESVAGTVIAGQAGADRVELCSALVAGGLTPTLGTVRAALAAAPDLGVLPIIRPRGGDFIYDDHEVAAMEQDILEFRREGVHGVVIGALTPEGEIDVPVTARLLDAAGPLTVTFHRAFDMTVDPRGGLETLIELGVERVLTSGQEATALEGVELLAELIGQAAGRIVVMPGSGVNEDNAATIIARSKAEELHFSGMDTTPGPAVFRNPRVAMGGGATPSEYERRMNSPERIRRIMAAAGNQATVMDGQKRRRTLE
ncbi:copper homeostasis protein CutC [Nocardiopsis ansamitocini]|uniref:PF03932 family protein CutC n=1 Tax=Nocardiopsis ansamitocini TaxID=1670832 RepID=A0A9W6P310_9ACTN|nr:copper homeostasis protein CutC [Nocardiopsis ansamitocini]GLU46345.1 copper homeostasis protein CutC [Nocardiopsis ansamitocini]